MKKWTMVVALAALSVSAMGQDIGWLLEQSPLVSKVFSKALEKVPPFSARAEVTVSGKADPVPTSALSAVESAGGNLRWDVRLGDIQSAQFSSNAKALLKQVNGDRLVLLTRPIQGANQLVFLGARAFIEQPLPAVTLSAVRAQSTEIVDGHSCVRETIGVREASGQAHEVILWRAKDLKKVPVQLQFTQSGEVIQIKFKDVRLRTIPPARFQVAPGLAKHETIEDLMQWVVAEKIKKRMGL